MNPIGSCNMVYVYVKQPCFSGNRSLKPIEQYRTKNRTSQVSVYDVHNYVPVLGMSSVDVFDSSGRYRHGHSKIRRVPIDLK